MLDRPERLTDWGQGRINSMENVRIEDLITRIAKVYYVFFTVDENWKSRKLSLERVGG